MQDETKEQLTFRKGPAEIVRVFVSHARLIFQASLP